MSYGQKPANVKIYLWRSSSEARACSTYELVNPIAGSTFTTRCGPKPGHLARPTTGSCGTLAASAPGRLDANYWQPGRRRSNPRRAWSSEVRRGYCQRFGRCGLVLHVGLLTLSVDGGQLAGPSRCAALDSAWSEGGHPIPSSRQSEQPRDVLY